MAAPIKATPPMHTVVPAAPSSNVVVDEFLLAGAGALARCRVGVRVGRGTSVLVGSGVLVGVRVGGGRGVAVGSISGVGEAISAVGVAVASGSGVAVSWTGGLTVCVGGGSVGVSGGGVGVSGGDSACSCWTTTGSPPTCFKPMSSIQN